MPSRLICRTSLSIASNYYHQLINKLFCQKYLQEWDSIWQHRTGQLYFALCLLGHHQHLHLLYLPESTTARNYSEITVTHYGLRNISLYYLSLTLLRGQTTCSCWSRVNSVMVDRKGGQIDRYDRPIDALLLTYTTHLALSTCTIILISLSLRSNRVLPLCYHHLLANTTSMS